MGNIKTKKNKIILFIFELFIIVIIFFCSYKIITYIVQTNEINKIYNEQTQYINETDNDDEVSYRVDFNSLEEINSDVVGFLNVNGTKISTTVVKTDDNSFYLNHNFYKEENSLGWIFADYRNRLDGTDKNLILYGHNMKNGTMFGTLNNIISESWCENKDNQIITFVTKNGEYKYQVFSVYKVKSESYYLTTDFNNIEYSQFISTLKSRSIYDFGIDVSEDDNILTLSTCANNSKYRIVLHAKQIN